MELVPALWTRNSSAIIVIVINMILFCPSPSSSRMEEMLLRPSIAVVTVTAGVITPSASRAAPPIMAGKMSHFPKCFTRLYREKIPPSPWLSACMATTTYFIVVSRVMVQMTRDSAPKISSSLTPPNPPLPATIDFITYMGDVPISPYTTPIVINTAPALVGISCVFFVLSAVISKPLFRQRPYLPAHSKARRRIFICTKKDGCITTVPAFLPWRF